jgi:hypothetical protein
MFRVLITVGLTLIFALVSMAVYTTVGTHTRTEVELQLHERLKGAHQSITHLQQLSNSATLARAKEVARDKSLVESMRMEVEGEEGYLKRHQVVLNIVNKWKGELTRRSQGAIDSSSGRLEDWQAKKPYFFNIIDASGLLVADMNNARSFAKTESAKEYSNISKKYPILNAALGKDAESFYDVWQVGHQLLVGVSPIIEGDQVLGAVVIGYHINQSSEEYKRSLLADVGYFFQGKLQGSSTLGKEESVLEESVSQLLETYKRTPYTPIKVKLNDRTLLLRLGEVSGHKSSEKVHFFVAVNWSDTLENAMSIRDIVLIYLVFGLLVSLLLFWISLHYFVNPIKEIEEGVVRVTNGDLNYWFTYEVGKTDLSPTLSQHLDIMVSTLAGRDMPELTNDEEDS